MMRWSILCLFAVVVLGCDDPATGGSDCSPGFRDSCTCADGARGSRECLDGGGYGACQCEPGQNNGDTCDYDCTDRVCGDDGCGGVCGTCAGG